MNEKSAADSGIRQLIIHQCAFYLHKEIIKDRPHHFEKDLLVEIAFLLMKVGREAEVVRRRSHVIDLEAFMTPEN